MDTDENGDWLSWQLADSAFPMGGFAHSGGVEAAFQHGEIRSSADLAAFVENALIQIGHAAIPFINAAFSDNPDFAELDLLCDAFTSNHVANRSSRAQGQSLLASASRAFSNEPIKALRESILARELPGHLPPVFGTITRHLGLKHERALRLFVFTQFRGWIGSAVRLGIIGPLQGQTLQSQLSPKAEKMVADCALLGLNQIAQTAPFLDLLQGTQDRLYSRLFQS